MIAIPLIFGRLTAADYEDTVAADARIDALRAKVECVEEPQFTRDYHDPENAIDCEFAARGSGQWSDAGGDGGVSDRARRRREEGMPLLVEKFKTQPAAAV